MLKNHFNTLLDDLLGARGDLITNQQLIHCIDLTLLKSDATNQELLALSHQAKSHQVAALCVYPQHLSQLIEVAGINKATVINFPHGNEDLRKSFQIIEWALQYNTHEIDYVFPYQAYLGGNKQDALKQCETIIATCRTFGLCLKIILETGAFSEMDLVYQVSKELIHLGCDFLKTSTGKIPQGASLSDAVAILSAIKDTHSHCGIKLSGGIKTSSAAHHYAYLAEHILQKKIDKKWFRIGASTLLNELLKKE